jgi:hypothetical protein
VSAGLKLQREESVLVSAGLKLQREESLPHSERGTDRLDEHVGGSTFRL